MLQVVVLGTARLALLRAENIRQLLGNYSLGGPGEVMDGRRWTRDGESNPEETMLLCFHYEISTVTLLGSQTPPNQVEFVRKLMKLPGVYLECPECCKERFWSQNKTQEELLGSGV